MAATTGNSATLAFSEATTHVLQIVSISPGSESIEALETSHLGTSGSKTFIPSDLIETPEGTAEVLFPVGFAMPTPGTTHTVTITFPQDSANTATTGVTKATLAGTGFITMREFPEVVNDQVMRANIGWKLNGGTGPTFTPEAG